MDAGIVGDILSANTDQAKWLPRVYSRAQELAHAADMIDAGWVTVARTTLGVVGFMALHEGELHALYVTPDLQGRSIGTSLLDAAQARHDHIRLWSYQANIRATFFYRRAGFRETSRTNGAGNEARLPDIRFEWRREE